MSEFHVVTVQVGAIYPHPNADTLSLTSVNGYPVVLRTGEYHEGDLAVYVPVDAVVPDTAEWHFLCPKDSQGQPRHPVGQVPAKYRTIEAKRLRGIFSQGLLAKAPAGVAPAIGANVAEAMGITKYEPPFETSTNGDCEPAPTWLFPVYTDIEGLRRYPDVLKPGEPVVITEKIHGANARYAHDGQRLWVGSHRQVRSEAPGSAWWQAAQVCDLAGKLSNAPHYVFYGEVYGAVQDLKYGLNSVAFRAFDVFSVKENRYLDYAQARRLADSLAIDWVPVLYEGPWDPAIAPALCEGASTIATNVREGIVVRPAAERYDPTIGRVVLKRIGEGYLLRKKGKT